FHTCVALSQEWLGLRVLLLTEQSGAELRLDSERVPVVGVSLLADAQALAEHLLGIGELLLAMRLSERNWPPSRNSSSSTTPAAALSATLGGPNSGQSQSRFMSFRRVRLARKSQIWTALA